MQKKEKTWKQVLLYTVLILITFITLLPLLWMLSSSLKYDNEVFTVPIQWIPRHPKWENYKIIWEKIPLLMFTFNTIKLTLIVTLIQLITSSFAGYGFAKCRFKGRDLLFMMYVATIALPWQVFMLPQYSIMNKLGLVDSHLGYILLSSFSAFGVFLMRQFMIGIPTELLEAARIDGLSEHRIYAKIALPLTKPCIATLTIFTFVSVWNDYMGPMIYFNSTENKTIQLGVQMFLSAYATEYGLIMAISVLSLVPILIIFLCCQKYFVEGIASSGIKG